MSENKYRTFLILLYPETESYNLDEVISNAISYFEDYAYILHDKDVDPITGEVKKSHIHFIGKVSTPRTIDGVANKLTVPNNFVQPVHSFNKSLQYLTHLNDKNKFQYDLESIITNIQNLEKYFNKKNESLIVLEFYNRRCVGATMEDIFRYAIEINAYDVFRRNYNIIKSMHDERVYMCNQERKIKDV